MARILIVEDDYNFRRTMRAMLEQLSHEVYILKTADEALEFLDNTSLTRIKPTYSTPSCCSAEDVPEYKGQYDVDLVISDWHISGSKVDGVKFLGIIHVKFRGIKTVLMTADLTDEVPDIGCPVLRKPFEIDELRLTIEELMAA